MTASPGVDASVLERLDFLEARLANLSGVIREELVRRVAAAVRDELVREAEAVTATYATNSDLRIGARAVLLRLQNAELSGVVPALSELVKVEADSPGDLVKQLAEARALLRDLLPLFEEWQEMERISLFRPTPAESKQHAALVERLKNAVSP